MKTSTSLSSQTAHVFADLDGATAEIQYNSIEELMSAIFDFSQLESTIEFDDQTIRPLKFQDDIQVTLPDGRKFLWNATVAHYCFGKGRITENMAFDMMLNDKGGAQ